jgi:D-3-phosphoglycerate dehydrogenase
MTSPRVVVADPLAQGGIELLRSALDVVVPADESALRDAVGSTDALIVRSRTKVTSDLLDRAAKLRLVARAGIGVDNIDVAAATERGILVVNAPLGNVRSTAEHTVALIFALARRVTAADRAVRDGTWKAGYEGMQLSGKRLGVIGVGKIGRQVAAMAEAIGMTVLACDPYLPESVWPSLGLTPHSLDEVLRTADVITVHVPMLPETRGLIGASQIDAMKQGAYIVNCARGGLVDEAALADALTSGRLGGAALDVFEQEPLKESPLLTAPNVILTPHVAASTKEAQAQVSTDVAEAVLDFFAGKPPAYPVNPAVLGA